MRYFLTGFILTLLLLLLLGCSGATVGRVIHGLEPEPCPNLSTVVPSEYWCKKLPSNLD